MFGETSNNHKVTISAKAHDKVQSWLVKLPITIRKKFSAKAHDKDQSWLLKPAITIRYQSQLKLMINVSHGW